MKDFDFEYNTPIVIYGAGIRGQLFYHNLEKSGFVNIQLFLDRNAVTKKKILGKDVLAPNSEVLSPQFKTKAIVIISVTNVFEHEDIASRLNILGFENIIFKHLSGTSLTQSIRTINDIFDNILDMKYYQTKFRPIQKVSKYNSLTIENNNKVAVLREIDNDYLVASIPVELIFSLSKKSKLTHFETEELEKKFGLSNTFDAPFFNDSHQIALFKYFNTGERFELEKYINIIRFNYALIGKPLTEIEIERIISSREEVYCEMNNMLSVKDSFFCDNPIKLKWNSKGYFNILDGKHRLAFFIIKGLKNIPAKITKDDYNQWLNNAVLKMINPITLSNKFVHLLHPAYENANILTFFHSQTLFSLIRIIAKQLDDYKKLSALCVGLDAIYYFQYFNKMGMRAKQFIIDKEDSNKAKLLNELSYIDDEPINQLLPPPNQQTHNFDMVFISTLLFNSAHDIIKDLLDIITSTKASYCVVVCKSENENIITSELTNINFNYFTQLGRAHFDKGQINSMLFQQKS
jgi:hypothetical protein